MTDSQPSRSHLTEVLALEDRTRSARTRKVFWIILWVSAAWAWLVHASEETLTEVMITAALLIAMGGWLHGVHRIQGWTDEVRPGRALIMLLGVYVVLAGGLWMSSVYLVMLFGAFSITFAFCDRVIHAVIMSLVVAGIWTWAWVRWDLPDGGVVMPLVVWAVLNVIGYFTTQVADQTVERGELIAELERTRSQLAATEHQRGTLAERERLAAEIHDTLAQGFTSIVLVSEATRMRVGELDAETMEKNLGMIEDTARTNLTEARRLVDALRPASLDDRSLIEAIRSTAERMQSRTGAEVKVTATGDDAVLGGARDVVLLRVAQEALANCEKHADASAVAVNLNNDGRMATLTVTDDGQGFDPTGPTESDGGHGLEIMRQRARTVGGTVDLVSTPGEGTTLTVAVPVHTPTQAAEPHTRELRT